VKIKQWKKDNKCCKRKCGISSLHKG